MLLRCRVPPRALLRRRQRGCRGAHVRWRSVPGEAAVSRCRTEAALSPGPWPAAGRDPWDGAAGCPRDLRRGVGQRHPRISARALSSRAVAHGSALMEHEVMRNRLGSTGSDLNRCPSFSASRGWAEAATAPFRKPSPNAGLSATSMYPTDVECQEEWD